MQESDVVRDEDSLPKPSAPGLLSAPVSRVTEQVNELVVRVR